MKHLARFIAVIVLLLIVTTPATSQTSYTTHLPIFKHEPFPSCHRNGGIGIAWLNRTGPGAQEYLDRYCAAMYYNSSGGTYADIDPDEVPLIHCNAQSDFDKLATIPSWWNGFLLFGNEPGTPGQCGVTSATVLANSYSSIKAQAPAGAKMVSPNIIIQHQGTSVMGTGWLKNFLNQLVANQGGCDLFAVGIHFYGATQYSPATKLSWVKTAIDSTGCAGKPIIISEYGAHPGDNAFQLMSDITYLNSDPRVIATFGYTPVNAQSAIPWEETNPLTGINLTESGWGLFDGYRRLGLLD